MILLIIGLFGIALSFEGHGVLRNFAHEVGLTEQHKFAYYSKFSSTTVALLKVVDSWKFAIDDGLKSVCVYLDLRIAFDVKHDILLAKLESYGIKGNTLQWFNSYLLGRSQFVVCRDSASELRVISSSFTCKVVWHSIPKI